MSETPQPRFVTRAERRTIRLEVRQSLGFELEEDQEYPFAEVDVGGHACRFDLDPDGRPLIVSYSLSGLPEKVAALKPGQSLNVLGWLVGRQNGGLRAAPPERINAPAGKKLGASDAWALLEAMFNAELKVEG